MAATASNRPMFCLNLNASREVRVTNSFDTHYLLSCTKANMNVLGVIAAVLMVLNLLYSAAHSCVSKKKKKKKSE
jgi:hypothetical protein